jgi:hypothetical protein
MTINWEKVQEGTVTLIGMCSGVVGFGAVALDQRRVVDISGGSGASAVTAPRTAKWSAISVRHPINA